MITCFENWCSSIVIILQESDYSKILHNRQPVKVWTLVFIFGSIWQYLLCHPWMLFKQRKVVWPSIYKSQLLWGVISFFQGDCFFKSQAAHLNMGLECNVNITSFISYTMQFLHIFNVSHFNFNKTQRIPKKGDIIVRGHICIFPNEGISLWKSQVMMCFLKISEPKKTLYGYYW